MCNDRLFFDIDIVITELMKKREIFTSEADFQLALAQTIMLCYPEARVRLEYCYFPEENSNTNSCSENPLKMYIDILVLWGGKWIPIELKYKTKAFKYTDNDGCVYALKDQSAYDFGCYDYWRDVSRIKTIAKSNPNQYKKGYAIFLTNASTYYKNNYKNKEDNTKYRDFRIHQDRKIKGPTTLKWNGDPPKDEKYSEGIDILGIYSLKWEKYSTVTNDKGKQTIFKYLITEIKR